MSVELGLLDPFPRCHRHRGLPTQRSDRRLDVTDSSEGQDSFPGPGLFDVAPQHSLLGDGHRELPLLANLDLSVLVVARVIGVGIVGRGSWWQVIGPRSSVFRLGGFGSLPGDMIKHIYVVLVFVFNDFVVPFLLL